MTLSLPILKNDVTKAILLEKIHKIDQREREEIVNKLKANNLSDIEPHNHMDGMAIETDGSFNKDLHKELFLADHDDLDDLSEDNMIKKLNIIFKSADADKNDVLNSEEMENWIIKQINIHLNNAINRNKKMFEFMDTDKNGLIYWDEYYTIYERLHDLFGNNTDEPNDIDGIKRELSLIRERWTNADTNNDDALSINEFLGFRHPETNGASLKKLSVELMNTMDKNNDGFLSLNEFLYLPTDINFDDSERTFLKERKEEFMNMDRNKDNKVDIQELQYYMNPHNPRIIKSHVKQIFEFVDTNNNDLIDLNEMIENIKFFIDNKFVNAGDFVHDDL